MPVDWHTCLADLHTCSAEASYLVGRWAAVAVVVDRHFDMLDDLLETDIRLVLADWLEYSYVAAVVVVAVDEYAELVAGVLASLIDLGFVDEDEHRVDLFEEDFHVQYVVVAVVDE